MNLNSSQLDTKVPREAEALAKVLHEQLKRLDFGYEAKAWKELDGAEQNIYIYALWDKIKIKKDDILSLMSHCNTVGRCP
jgi:hypothetical protein